MIEANKGLDKAIRVIKLDIALSEQEELSVELDQLLQWLKPMLAVDAAETEQVLTGHSAVNILREDKPLQGDLAELQEAAPDFAGGYYLVPSVIE